MLPQKAVFHAGRQGIKLGANRHIERKEVQTVKVLKRGQALFYQGYWIGVMRSIMQIKLCCITEPLLMAHLAIVMKTSVVLRKNRKDHSSLLFKSNRNW